MIAISVEGLRNLAVVEVAQAKLLNAQGRLKNGEAVLARAIEDQKTTAFASREAILAAAAGDQTNPQAGADAHTQATMRAEFCARMLDDLENEVAEAMAEHAAAEGQSWLPIHEKGREIRLAASRAADQARADMKAAEALWHQGTGLIESAHANRFPRRFDGMYLYMNPPDMGTPRKPTVPTEFQERNLWGTLAPEAGAAE